MTPLLVEASNVGKSFRATRVRVYAIIAASTPRRRTLATLGRKG